MGRTHWSLSRYSGCRTRSGPYRGQAGASEEVEVEVAPSFFDPVVVLVGQHRSDEPDEAVRSAVWSP